MHEHAERYHKEHRQMYRHELGQLEWQEKPVTSMYLRNTNWHLSPGPEVTMV